MKKTGSFLNFVGGSIGRMAGTGIATGLFMVLVGLPPGEFVKTFFEDPPLWLDTVWFRIGILLLGISLIAFSLRYNVWSSKQVAIDDLAEKISWAISQLLNRSIATDQEFDIWKTDYNDWVSQVSQSLSNRAFFTRADQLHFERLGSITAVGYQIQYNDQHNKFLTHLSLRFDRLRDVMNWTQQRRR